MPGRAPRPDPTPLDVAARLLQRAPLSEASLVGRLVAKGYRPATAAATVDRCRELGWLCDETFAHDRARALRARGAGCLKVVADLEQHGVPSRLVTAAVEASLDGMSEADLARTVIRQAGFVADGPRAWRLLAARGFPEDVMADVVEPPD